MQREREKKKGHANTLIDFGIHRTHKSHDNTYGEITVKGNITEIVDLKPGTVLVEVSHVYV